MGAISIREFNGNVSRYIARAEKGEVIEVTRNGKVVAEVRAPSRPDRDSPEWKESHRRLMELLRQGVPIGRTFSYEERNG